MPVANSGNRQATKMNIRIYFKRCCLIFVGLLWFGIPSLRATDRYVSLAGTNDVIGGYANWAGAATNIQWAVNVATNTETVWVSNGVYVLTNQIAITNGIILRSAEGHGPDDTIINGNFVAGSAATNNRCLVISNSAALVHGFTISNGAVYATYGGGVLMTGGVLSNCCVRNNTLFAPENVVCSGGGIYMSAGTVAVCRVTYNVVSNFNIADSRGEGGGIYSDGFISDCIISSNTIFKGPTSGTFGGGGGVVSKTSTTIQSSLVSHNYSESSAGGIWIQGGLIVSSTVTFNYGKGLGGGIGARSVTISYCVVSYNNGVGGGGGIYARPSWPGYVQVYNTTFTGNTNAGLDIYPSDAKSPIVIDNCIIEDNLGTGPGISIRGDAAPPTNVCILNSKVLRNLKGPGIICAAKTKTVIRNCLIANNYDSQYNYAGGLYLASTSSVSGCTIVSNRAYPNNLGAGIKFAAAAPGIISVSSCIIYSNGVSGTDDVYDAASPANINALQYSCVGTNPGFTGAGIIVASPQFKNFVGGDYRLAPSLLCINRGSNEDWMTNAVDLDGRTRIRYGTVDMGAYERINQGAIYGFH